MAREKFTESIHCGFNSRCKTCRDAQNVEFRKSLTRVCDLPDDNINFACPHGMAWIGDNPEFLQAVYEPNTPVVPHTPTGPTGPTGPSVSTTSVVNTQGKTGGCGCKGNTAQGDAINPQTGQPVEIRIPNPEFMANISRSQCPDCTRKHLAQAIINIQESVEGHPELRILAIGHLCEAYAECRFILPDIAVRLDDTWRKMFKEPTFIPELMLIIEEISKRIEDEAKGLQGVQKADSAVIVS